MNHARHRRREGGVYLIIMCQCDYSFYFYLCISLILYHYIVSSRYYITVIPLYYIPFYSMINEFIFLQCHSLSFPFSFIKLYFNPSIRPHLLYYLLFNEVLYNTLLIKIVLLYSIQFKYLLGYRPKMASKLILFFVVAACIVLTVAEFVDDLDFELAEEEEFMSKRDPVASLMAEFEQDEEMEKRGTGTGRYFRECPPPGPPPRSLKLL